ncbi:hypothetical protein ACH4FX_12120 [Streptomyces sp. NPDC018019]|uniref:hypothetical protein n=1 Tax=Streptomyces sp. NPDC018019 TaxID=3365030 RepID=UPI003795A356
MKGRTFEDLAGAEWGSDDAAPPVRRYEATVTFEDAETGEECGQVTATGGAAFLALVVRSTADAFEEDGTR